MKSFLKDNPTIAFGLGLPLLLVIVFLLVSGIPNLLVAGPKFDVLYATGYNAYRNPLQISVVDNRVQLSYGQVEYPEQIPRLWLYMSDTGAVREIPIILPSGLRQSGSGSAQAFPESRIIEVAELQDVAVDSSSIAPDGYEFTSGNSRYSRNVFGGLFYSSRYYREAVLSKDGRRIRLPNVSDHYYGRNTQFVGWVIPK
ncbi:MAG: hypothetical protein AAF431_13660 [Pseudomonadota bacterium]